MTMTRTVLFFFALLLITAWPAMADCPAFFTTPRVQTEARKIIEVHKQNFDKSGSTFYESTRTPQEFSNLIYGLFAGQLRGRLTITRQQILDMQKDPRLSIVARNDPRVREMLESNASEYPDDPNYVVVDKLLRDQLAAIACFPELGPFLQFVKEYAESRRRKAEEEIAEAKRPAGLLRQTYFEYITLQRCSAQQDYSGPLLTEPDLQRAKEATRRAEYRLAPQLDQGLTSAQVWDQALALPPKAVGGISISRLSCMQTLSVLLQANPATIRLEKP